MNSKHGRQWIRRPPALALGVITGYLLLQLRPGDQLVHPLQKEFAASLSLFVLVLGFGEGDLIHGSTEPYAVDDVRIIAEGRDFFRASIVSFLLSTSNGDSYKILESALSGVLGALLGGIITAVSIIFGLLTTRSEKFQIFASNNEKFSSFIKGLKQDAYILLGCTFLAIFLPYLRNIDIVFLQYPTWQFMPSKNMLFTTAEIMIVILSFVVIAEIISVLFKVFEIALIKEDEKKV